MNHNVYVQGISRGAWLSLFLTQFAGASITIPTLPIGQLGNAPDPSTGLGAVAGNYSIGATEVTNAQYAAFLGSVAASDPNMLYNPAMASGYGGIVRTGADGSYTYAPIPGRENHPVNFVSFSDAARFSNWLHNGQPTGGQDSTTTEDGAYLLGGGEHSSVGVVRKAGARWALPTENEWYKAAFFQPASLGGDSDNYWLYPNSSNTVSTADANYNWAMNGPTPVGSYAPNYFGAFDMGGNAWEWNELVTSNAFRGFRGGAYWTVVTVLAADVPARAADPTSQTAYIGFRVAEVPSPSATILLATGVAAACTRRRR